MLTKQIISLSNKYANQAKKSLGQNFLIDLEIYEQIKYSIGDLSEKQVLEIGPGLGSLTHIILSLNPSKLTAIEKDKNFISLLRSNLEHYNNKFSVIEADALKIDITEIYNKPCYIIANLPYNISTVLLFNWVNNIKSVEAMFLMFQKEVAERIIALPGTKKFGRIAIMVQLFCEVELLFDIDPQSFNPPPKVKSSFVKIIPRKVQLVENVNVDNLEKITNILFSQRRKMLSNTLKKIFKENIYSIAAKKIDVKKRPEELSIEEFCFLAGLLEAK